MEVQIWIEFHVVVHGGNGNIKHNLNKNSRQSQKHIDNKRIDDNIVLKDINPKNIEEEFNKIFFEDIQEYNAKQKRKDRQITNYYQKCLNDKKIKAPFREVIYQVGNREDAKDPVKKEKMTRSLIKFYNEFEKNYTKMKILGAVIHLDEATPHLHIDVVPYADGGKNGLKHKVSFEKAIEQMGFEAEQSQINKSTKNPLIFNGFRNHSMKLLENILNNEALQRDIKHNVKKHIEPNEYREKMAIEDLKKDENIQEKAKKEILTEIINEMTELEKNDIIIKEQNQTIDLLYYENKELKKENTNLKNKNNIFKGFLVKAWDFLPNKLQDIFCKIFSDEERNNMQDIYENKIDNEVDKILDIEESEVK